MARTTPRLTDKAIRAFPPALPGKRYERWDGTGSLGVRVTDRGTKTFFVSRMVDGRKVRVTLGVFDEMKLADARDAAADKRREVKGGTHVAPRVRARMEREAAKKAQARIFDAVADAYLAWAETELRPSTLAEYKRLLRHDARPKWGKRDAASITADDVRSLLAKLAGGTARRPIANRVHAVLSALFRFAVHQRVLTGSPIVDLPKAGKENVRDRDLSDDELHAVLAAFDQEPEPLLRGYLWLLILTAQRRSEVANMRWDRLDLDTGRWDLKAEETKAKRGHIVPLSTQAVAILRALAADRRHAGCPFVFSLTGRTSFSGFSKLKSRLPALGEPWTFHDLRRTAATGMARLGVSNEIVGRVLNHARNDITSKAYNRFDYEPEKRTALQAWANHLDAQLSR